MNIIAIFVLGILVGWIAEWILDWFYWRKRTRAAIKSMVDENEQLDNQNADLTRANKTLDEAYSDLKLRFADLQNEVNRLKAAAIIGHILDEKGNHNFQAIKGIGPAFSKRLKDSGIRTFEQLAQLTPQDMERILGTLYKRFFSKENTILEQAKEFAKHIATLQGENKA